MFTVKKVTKLTKEIEGNDFQKIKVQLTALYHKYGVKSIKELECAIEKGTVVESDVFDDLTKIDHLETKIQKIKGKLKN